MRLNKKIALILVNIICLWALLWYKGYTHICTHKYILKDQYQYTHISLTTKIVT